MRGESIVQAADWDELLRADRAHVWHPYGPMPARERPLPVVSAEGVRLRLADGRELIDGMASWWCAMHGYRHPALDRALAEQLERMAHVMFGGLTHEGAVRLARRLVELTPHGLEHVFFSDSGSVSVEVAVKMCLQAQPGRHRVMSLRGGYHGDTFMAMSLCDPVGGMHHLFSGALPEQLFAPRPPDGVDAGLDAGWAAAVEALFSEHARELAALIVEPIVQGAGGMRFHSPACLAWLRALCDRHGVLLIADEVATGFGRTGAWFACQHADVAPDVLCLGKTLTGGYLSLAATLCSTRVASAITGGALMHGPTYMANPLACAAALASIELLSDERWRADVARIERGLSSALLPARELPGVADVRVLGAIGVIELERPVDVAAATRAAVDRGVWLRPFRELVYAMPPYVCDDAEVAAIGRAMVAAAEAA